jgi:hypothetical protein
MASSRDRSNGRARRAHAKTPVIRVVFVRAGHVQSAPANVQLDDAIV